MTIARYEIVPVGERWSVRHDGGVNLEYATKESAFEAASVAASMAIREGHEVLISVPGEKQDRP